MSTKDKLLRRFKTLPKDFTFDELVVLLKSLGYWLENKGKTSGSRVVFRNKNGTHSIYIHKPHTSGQPIKETALKMIYDELMLQQILN
ncbi:hypothetical protein AGMMS49982_03430 [Bacteroidia bacterium]|nr:hypothetical protein AGMMS49982_03430 [Bacteroidia bacterium]